MLRGLSTCARDGHVAHFTSPPLRANLWPSGSTCDENPQQWDTNSMELWGGVECTVNRIGDRYSDQLALTGHRHRLDDLGRIASLGIRTIRYPVLWEDAAQGDSFNWAWADERLPPIREHGLTPIVGLVHHGSGPLHTDLLDPLWPKQLAEYAGAVAERYPWVSAYTPVNEPLTTARFSALYGHWYPHAQSDQTFVRALLHQIRGTILAMRAIRKVNPDSRLIQTEDLGYTHATDSLAEQAAFENERRWLTFDLLMGRVDYRHPLHHYLTTSGATRAELEWLRDNAMTPDVLGLNYYVLSERYLDDTPCADGHAGGNGRQAYTDRDAVRSCGLLGLAPLLRQVAGRYEQPMAVTEAHLAGHREDQIRWLMQTWDAAIEIEREGLPLLAVTAWSLFGAYDWDSLCTREGGCYETGAFDVRSDPPRPTALAECISALATGRRPQHSVLAGDGWWAR